MCGLSAASVVVGAHGGPGCVIRIGCWQRRIPKHSSFCSFLKRHVFTSVYVTRWLVARLLPEARLWLIGMDVKGRCFVGSKGVKRSRSVDVVVVALNSGMQMIRSYQYSETKKRDKKQYLSGSAPEPGSSGS